MTQIDMNAQSEIFGMDTVITYNVFGGQSDLALKAAEKETLRLERMLSRFVPQSDISRINLSAGIRSEEVSRETYELLNRAVEFSKSCSGCFDVTIAPLADLWIKGKETSLPPDRSAIKRVLPLVDYNDLVLDHSRKSVGLKKVGQSIDLGGIGKGYTADKVVEMFKKFGITSAFTNFGGNVAVIGAKSDGSPWHIGIQHPRQEGKLMGVVSVVGKSVVTSGDYQRYFIGGNGKRYHHIMNPSTGYPSESGLIGVTVISNSSMVADALSTILFVSGKEKGLQILKGFSETEVIMLDTNQTVYITPNLAGIFKPCGNKEVRILTLF